MPPYYTPLSNIDRSGPSGDPDFDKARNIVDIQYDPQRNQLQRNIDQMLRQRDQEVDVQQQYLLKADPQLEQLYNQLYGNLEQGIDRTRGLYDAGELQVGSYYDRATADTQAATDKIMQDTNHQAARLGIEAGTPDVNRSFNDTLLKAISRNNTSRAGAQSNLAALGTDMEALAIGGLNSAQREGTAERSTLLNNVQRAIADATLQAGEGIYDAYGGLADIEQVRGQALAKAYDDVFNARTERERQARLDALAEEIQRNTMRLQNEGFAADQQNAAFERARTSQNDAFARSQALAESNRAEQQLQLQRQQAEREYQLARSQLERDRASQQIAAIDRSLSSMRSRGAAGGYTGSTRRSGV